MPIGINGVIPRRLKIDEVTAVRLYQRQTMSPKMRLITLLLLVAGAGIAIDQKLNGRREYSVTSSPQELIFAPSTESAAGTANLAETPPPADKPVATIGVILPLSGVQAVYGQGIKEGLDLAVQGVNGTEKMRIAVKLVYEDTRSDPKNAAAAAKKLIAADKAIALISALSPTSLIVAPIAQAKGTVLFTVASLATQLNAAGSFVFKNDDVSSKLGVGLAEAARAKGVVTAGVIAGNYNDSVVESKDAFMKEFAARGGTITGEEGFTADATDFRTSLQKLIATPIGGPDTIAVFGLQRDCALITRQLDELGYRKPLFGFTCFDDPEVVVASGAAIEGATFVSFNGIPTEKFSKLVRDAYGHEPLRWSAEAFDALKLLSAAMSQAHGIRKGVLTSDGLREVLENVHGYSGEAGSADFDREGNAIRSLYLKTVRNGKIEIVQ